MFRCSIQDVACGVPFSVCRLVSWVNLLASLAEISSAHLNHANWLKAVILPRFVKPWMNDRNNFNDRSSNLESC